MDAQARRPSLFRKRQRPHLLHVVPRQPAEILTVRPVSVVVDNQVDGHFPLQTADVAVTEVIAQLVNLTNQQFIHTDAVKRGGDLTQVLSPSPAPAGGTAAPGWPGASTETPVRVHKPWRNTAQAQNSLTKSSSSGFEEKIGFSLLIWRQRNMIFHAESSANADETLS